MPELPVFTSTVYCNRCDRGFTSISNISQLDATQKAFARLETHVVKHPDYVPELHSEIDPE